MTIFSYNRKALFFSVVALIICIIMLLGATYAWFSDSATSPDNNIQTGNLDIVLEYWDGTTWVDAEENVIPFVAADGRDQSEILWEPGCTYNMAPFRVRNEGSLCAKILITINGISGDAKLLEVIDFETTINNIPASVLNGSAGNQLQQFEDATVNIMTGMPEGDIVFDWSLAGKDTTTPGTGHTDTSPEFTISAHMAEEAGNEYMNLTLEGISITVLATQQTYESDAFGNSYDKNATFPEVGNVVKAENEVKTVSIGNIKIDIPASAPVGSYEMAVSNKNETTDADGNTTLTMDIVLKKDGAKVAADGTTIYTVAIEIGANKTVTAITHNGEAVTNYNYDPFTGIISFETTSFSPFTFTFADAPADSIVVRISNGNAFYHATLADAVNAAADGEPLTVLADIDLGTERVTIKGKELTINLNEKTITSANNRTIMVDLLRVNNADKRGVLTLTGNGTVKNTQDDASNGFAVYVGGSSDLIVNEGVTVESVCGKAVILAPMGLDNGAARYSTLNVNGGRITGRYAITGYGSARDTYITVNVNSGIVYGRDVAIYQPQFGDVTVNGGTVTGVGEAAIAMRSGNLTVNGGTVNGIIDILGDHHASNGEDAYSTATFNGGNFDNATIKYSVGNGNVIFKADDVEAIAPDGYKWDANGNPVACEYVAAIGKVKFDTLAAALEYANAKNIVDLEIVLIGANDKATAAALEDAFDLCYQKAFNSVTFKQADPSKVYYVDCLYTGSRTNGGYFVFDGVNIHVISQYIFEGNVKLINNSIIASSAEANCFIYNGITTLEPGSKLQGVIEDFRGGDMIVDGGKTDGSYNTDPDVRDAIMHIRWSGDKLILKNGAYVNVNSANEVGRMNLEGGTAVELTASKLDVCEYINVASGAQIKTDIASVITTNKITGIGKIYIDATAFDGTEVQVIKANMSGFTGTVEVNGDATYEIVANGIIVKAVAEQ